MGDEGLPAKLTEVSWRVDVAISSSAVAKVMEPQINLELAFDDDRPSKHFGMTQDKFQQLRFSVASILKQMEMLEKKKVFKGREVK